MRYTFTDKAKTILMGVGLIAADAEFKDVEGDAETLWQEQTLSLGIHMIMFTLTLYIPEFWLLGTIDEYHELKSKAQQDQMAFDKTVLSVEFPGIHKERLSTDLELKPKPKKTRKTKNKQ